ncbi:hypothetical protein GJ654_18760 [Rhodoblastus acidophilus]|uniref:Bacteriophage lambda head decoration protein D n=1 Tax=Rhodoblastus acidophilus TaxID=1074 RepID=A0A6N8DTY2_RHOAC|nr:head decoration protein [Rhodoblastus acidophilus]MCW2276370.1 hypothetical protein [Rhodoblastus acidophilus]MTV33025.1 hypothetical protein [Rhodoblastus acidophilus]
MVAPVRTYTQPKILSDLVKYEEEVGYSRDTGTLKAGETTVIGTPVAHDANGKVVALPNDGSLACIGVSIAERSAGVADVTDGALYIANNALLADSGIVWPSGISGANKTKAVGELRALPGPVKVRAAV